MKLISCEREYCLLLARFKVVYRVLNLSMRRDGQ
jgi:hypothetical protein